MNGYGKAGIHDGCCFSIRGIPCNRRSYIFGGVVGIGPCGGELQCGGNGWIGRCDSNGDKRLR